MQNCEASKAQLLKYVAALSKKPRLCANAGSYLRSVKRNVALSSTLALKQTKKNSGCNFATTFGDCPVQCCQWAMSVGWVVRGRLLTVIISTF